MTEKRKQQRESARAAAFDALLVEAKKMYELLWEYDVSRDGLLRAIKKAEAAMNVWDGA